MCFIAELDMGKQSLIAKKLNFGYLSMWEIVCSHMNILLPICLSTPQGYQCEMSHFLTCVETCNNTVHIHVEVNINSCQNWVTGASL